MEQKTILTTILILMITISFASAAQPLPHAFKGNIKISDGGNPDGLKLIGKINNIPTGECIIENNSFDIILTNTQGLTGNIKFFIGNEESEELFDFFAFTVTETDLNFKKISLEENSCGDSICAVLECSFCAIDCTPAICENNNVCDSAIGEDVVTAPNDCKIIAPETPSNGGSSSGGGSGGGSSSDSSSTKIKAENSTQNMIEEEISKDTVSIEELNKQEKIKEILETEEKNKFGITGYSILMNDNGKPRASTTIAIIILAGFLFLFTRKKLSKLKKKK